ncbi:hypothetical protein SM114_03565 [Erwinia pyrifoliae]|uniref:YobI family P-loop NTPase n=2 Tax=Erwinia pyrifoliae TaxID=79967 RepID=UPI0001C130C5|nr:hypothetical protein CPI84_05230 [Erwinia pyrifoliae]CAY75237.1 hypothetical protein EPYR_02857 [Erwinia pyrifoliae DSM 12163]
MMMEKINRKFLKYAATRLKKLVSKINELLKQDDVSPESKYTALTPSKIEGPNEYFTAMDYALSQKEVRNIAVTGAYGAGKSTIISSYMDTLSIGRHISVSLAGFDMEKKGDPKPQEVELSILQQILYKENSDALPDSRIDRILNRNGRHIRRVFFSALKLAVPLSLLLALIFPDKALSIAGIPASIVTWFDWAVPYKSLFVLLSFGLSLYCISAFTSRIGIFDKKIKLNKISLLSGEVETGSGESSSLLNNCLDEMVYFFSKIQDYRIVVFEDLDRLKDHDIFVKLREINTIINNNLSEDNPLRFIYAVRDDVFPGAESRTKFFDFIIPVVSVMDVRNAYSLLNSRLGDSVPGIQDCLRGTSMYINDMRCLQNIVNEYLIFESMVDNNNRKVNLYSLIFYKNTFSHDYGLIDRKISLLYRFVHDYRHLILHDEYFSNLKETILLLSGKLKSVIEEHASTSLDIRESIIASLIPKRLRVVVKLQHSKDNYHFYSYDTNALVSNESEFIEFLESQENIRVGSVICNGNSQDSFILSQSERADLQSDYERRKTLIGDDRAKAIEKAKSDLAEAKEKQRRKKAISLSGLVSLMTLEQFSARAEGYLNALDTHTFLSEEKRKLIRDEMRYGGTDALYLLLSRGFLDQDFMRSRSVFHEGGLSPEDNEFIKQIPLGLSFEKSNDSHVIDDVRGVTDEIRAQNFLHFDAVLHHQILAYLLQKNDSSLDDMIATLFNKTGDIILEVLNSLENRFKEPDSFAQLLVRIIDKNRYLNLLITHLQAADKSDENTLLAAAVVSYAQADWADNSDAFRDYVEALGPGIVHHVEALRMPEFLTLIRSLAVRYETFTPAASDGERELHCFAGQHHLYRLTSENVGHVLSARLSSHGYTVTECRELPWSLASSHDTATHQYFLQDPETFVREVFLTSQEDAAAVNAVLFLTPLSDDLKLRIVREMSFCLDSLAEIPREPGSEENGVTLSFRDLFYRYDRVYARWAGLLADLENGGDQKVITCFMARHADILGEDCLEDYDEKTYANAYQYVICNSLLDENSYKKILRNTEVRTELFDSKITEVVIIRLLKNSKVELNKDNYSIIISRAGTGDDMLEAMVFWFGCYKKEFMADSEFYLQAIDDNNAFEKLLIKVTGSGALPDSLKNALIIQQAEYYLSLPDNELPLSEEQKLSVFYLSQDERFKMKIMRTLILSRYRNRAVLGQMAETLQNSELKKIFNAKTRATLTLNDRESCIPLLNDLRQAGLIKDYELREENKVFVTSGGSAKVY